MPDFISSALPKEAQTMADSTAAAGRSIETQLRSLADMPAEQMLDTLLQWGLQIAGKLILAVVIFVVGRWLIRRLLRMQRKVMDRRETDPSLRVFLNNVVQIGLTLILISFIIGVLGIDTTSLVAIFASAGLAVGMALSGTLQNFAGGVMILLIKPFRVGDFVEMQGQSGSVKEIQIFHTVLNTPDNKTIMLPNGAISNGIINNYTRESYRRAEWVVGIAYGEDVERARQVVLQVLAGEGRVQPAPAPMVAVHSLGASSVNLLVHAWVATGEFARMQWDFNEMVYKAFGQHGIEFPFPQMDVHLNSGEKSIFADKSHSAV